MGTKAVFVVEKNGDDGLLFFQKGQIVFPDYRGLKITSQQTVRLRRGYLPEIVKLRALERLIQGKLTNGQPGDKYEQEADRLADQVMRMPDPQTKPGMMVSHLLRVSRIQRVYPECEAEMQRQSMEEEEELQRQSIREEEIQRQALEEKEELQMQPMEEEEEMLQGKAADGGGLQVSNRMQSQIDSLRGGGQPLSESVRVFIEPRFRQDFGGVQIHTGGQAADTVKSINTRAFTVGKDLLWALDNTHLVQPRGKNYWRMS